MSALIEEGGRSSHHGAAREAHFPFFGFSRNGRLQRVRHAEERVDATIDGASLRVLDRARGASFSLWLRSIGSPFQRTAERVYYAAFRKWSTMDLRVKDHQRAARGQAARVRQ